MGYKHSREDLLAAATRYVSLASVIIERRVEWIEPRIIAPTRAERRRMALASIAILDGLLLLRHVSGTTAANAAARAIGIG